MARSRNPSYAHHREIAEELLGEAKQQLRQSRLDFSMGREQAAWVATSDAYETLVRASGEMLHFLLGASAEEFDEASSRIETEIFELLEATRRQVMAGLGVMLMPTLTPRPPLRVLPGGKSNPARHAQVVVRHL